MTPALCQGDVPCALCGGHAGCERDDCHAGACAGLCDTCREHSDAEALCVVWASGVLQ